MVCHYVPGTKPVREGRNIKIVGALDGNNGFSVTAIAPPFSSVIINKSREQRREV